METITKARHIRDVPEPYQHLPQELALTRSGIFCGIRNLLRKISINNQIVEGEANTPEACFDVSKTEDMSCSPAASSLGIFHGAETHAP